MYTINLSKEQFEELQNNKTLTINLNKQKQEKWTPSSGEWNIELVDHPSKTNIKDKRYTEAGFEYETEEEAIYASKALRVYARQLKWLSENSDGWKPDWKDTSKDKYYIYYDTNTNVYNFNSNQVHKNLNTIYMSKKNAEKLARLLNEGVVEF